MSDTLTAAALASDSRKMQHSRASDSAASLANLSLKAGTQGASRPYNYTARGTDWTANPKWQCAPS